MPSPPASNIGSVATVCAALRCAHLAEGAGIAGGGPTGSRQAHRILAAAGVESAGTVGFRLLSRCTQPGGDCENMTFIPRFR